MIEPYHKAQWTEFLEALDSGQALYIDDEIYDYFLGVLPPIFMGKHLGWPEKAHPRRYDFGFAEGAEPLTVFWTMNGNRFCQRTNIMNPYA